MKSWLVSLIWDILDIFSTFEHFTKLKGNCTPDEKLTCFALYLKIDNTFWKIICASYSNLSKELKSSIET